MFEASAEGVGGTWRYCPHASPSSSSSMYEALTTNLTKRVMQFSDLPFPADVPEHPGHAHVLAYLERYWDARGLRPLTRLGCAVEACERDARTGEWTVRYVSAPEGMRRREMKADALVVANGHYTVPYVPPVEGLAGARCRVMHAHEYRRPSDLAGLRVLVVGGGYSGVDICNELACAEDGARAVALSVRGEPRHAEGAAKVAERIRESGKRFVLDGDERSARFLGRRPEVRRLLPGEPASVEFADGTRMEGVDAVLFCTGYVYEFPFLPAGLVRTPQRRVEPLFEDVFHCDLGGSLSFVGVPWQVVPFPLCELQGEWIARVLSGERPLPPPERMHKTVRARLEALDAVGLPRRLLHRGGAGSGHAAYCRRVLEHAGLSGKYRVFDDRALRPGL